MRNAAFTSSWSSPRHTLAVVCSVALAGLTLTSLAACSSSDSGSSSGSSGSSGSSDGGSSGSSGSSGAADGGSDAGEDAAAAVVNDCKAFVDHTGASDARTLNWTFSIAQSPDRCMTIKKGQSVTWSGDFTTHPLKAQGGDTPNPVSSADLSGASATVTFPSTGTFGFACAVHPAMQGAIQVVE